MTRFGSTLITEQSGPTALIGCAQAGEPAGPDSIGLGSSGLGSVGPVQVGDRHQQQFRATTAGPLPDRLRTLTPSAS